MRFDECKNIEMIKSVKRRNIARRLVGLCNEEED